MELSDIGKLIAGAGLILVAFGSVLWLAGKTGLPVNGLPGDIRIERGRFSFYFPIVTCLVVSALLTLALSAAAWFFRR